VVYERPVGIHYCSTPAGRALVYIVVTDGDDETIAVRLHKRSSFAAQQIARRAVVFRRLFDSILGLIARTLCVDAAYY